MTVYDLVLFGLAVLAGAVAALAGFGIGSLLTPVLAVSLGVQTAVVVVSIPHMVTTGYRFWLLRRDVNRHVLLTFGVASAVGGLLGAVVATFLANSALAMVLGVLLILAGALELTGIGHRLRLGDRAAVGLGALSGVFGGLVGNQGGIRAAALLHFDLRGPALVATSTAVALMVDGARVPIYILGNADALVANLRTIVLLTAGGLVGTVLGAPVLRRLPERLFRRTMALLLIGLGVLLIVSVRQ